MIQLHLILAAVSCQIDHFSDLFRMINAASTPGIQPKRVNINTITIEPQPLSNTAKGGNKIDKITLQMLILNTKIEFIGHKKATPFPRKNN